MINDKPTEESNSRLYKIFGFILCFIGVPICLIVLITAIILIFMLFSDGFDFFTLLFLIFFGGLCVVPFALMSFFGVKLIKTANRMGLETKTNRASLETVRYDVPFTSFPAEQINTNDEIFSPSLSKADFEAPVELMSEQALFEPHADFDANTEETNTNDQVNPEESIDTEQPQKGFEWSFQ